MYSRLISFLVIFLFSYRDKEKIATRQIDPLWFVAPSVQFSFVVVIGVDPAPCQYLHQKYDHDLDPMHL